MNRKGSYRLIFVALAVVLAAVSASPTASMAPTLTGQARVVEATTLATTVLADTGTLGSAGDSRDATLRTGTVPSVLSGNGLRAVTVGWTDQVASEASMSNLTMAVGGTGISADLVMARALSSLDGGDSGSSTFGNLSINGVPVAVTGSPNQRIAIPGGQVVLNEQRTSAAGTTVNAIHATVFGVADVVVASATAGVR
jgi:hypothetical protein